MLLPGGGRWWAGLSLGMEALSLKAAKRDSFLMAALASAGARDLGAGGRPFTP